MTKNSLKDIAKAIGEDERAHVEQKRAAEEQLRREREEEAEAQTTFDGWKPTFAVLANTALRDICAELMRNGTNATLHEYPIKPEESVSAREEFAQQMLTWMCWVDVTESITPRNKHKAGRIGQARIITRIGFVVPDGVWRVLPFARRKGGEYAKFGEPIFREEPPSTADEVRNLIEPLFIKALDD